MTLNAVNDNAGNARCGIVRHSTLWVRPETVVRIDFLEWTGANHLRHAKFVALRDDKDPQSGERDHKLG
jgi:ATP-dependent DNA ligase